MSAQNCFSAAAFNLKKLWMKRNRTAETHLSEIWVAYRSLENRPILWQGQLLYPEWPKIDYPQFPKYVFLGVEEPAA